MQQSISRASTPTPRTPRAPKPPMRREKSVASSPQSLANGPHYVVPGQLVAAVKRTATQTYSLAPDPQFWQVFLYLLGASAARYKIELVQVALMSTHYHVLFVDTLGDRGQFFRFFHSNLGKVMTVLRSSTRPLLGVQTRTGQQEQLTVEAAVETLAYITNNPLNAQICATPEEWPGIAVARNEMFEGKVIRVERPESLKTSKGVDIDFFDTDVWPDWVDVTFAPPLEFLAKHKCSIQDYRELVQREFAMPIEPKSNAKGFGTHVRSRNALLGVKRALSIPTWRRCQKNPAEHRAMRPRVKAGRGQTEVRRAALNALGEFQAKHKASVTKMRTTLRGGRPIERRDIKFPKGTYLWARVFAVPVVGSPYRWTRNRGDGSEGRSSRCCQVDPMHAELY